MTSTSDEELELGFTHRFLPSNGSSTTLLLLHGTGGDENDMIPLGRRLLPEASMLSPRGRVLENGMPRFFRRLAEGVFDTEDLIQRTQELAEFLERAAAAYRFDIHKVVAVGYSNGANIASSLLLLHPHLLAEAVLFRPMVSLRLKSPPDLKGKRILILSGTEDVIVDKRHPEELLRQLRDAGGEVTLHWEHAGHPLTENEVQIASKWLVDNFKLAHGKVI